MQKSVQQQQWWKGGDDGDGEPGPSSISCQVGRLAGEILYEEPRRNEMSSSAA